MSSGNLLRMAQKFRQYQHLSKSGPEGLKPPSDKVLEHPLMSGAVPVGLMTAENPMFPVKTQGGNQALGTELTNLGLKFEQTQGRYGAPENSFIVYGPTKQQMFDLGHRYGQESVIHSEHGRHELLYTNGDNIGRGHPSLPKYDYFPTEAPEDYYTKLPSGGYLRLYFDFDKVHDTPLRPLVQAMPSYQHSPQPADVAKSEVLELLSALHKSIAIGRARPHPNAYDWHDGHTDHHFIVKAPGAIMLRTKSGSSMAKAEGDPHPHMDTPPVPQNDQAAGAGVSTYPKYAAPYGTLDRSRKTDLFHYPLQGKLPQVQKLVADHGYRVYYAGGSFGRPDLVSRNYNTGHLMVYDPTPSSGGDFGDRDYTDAWRQSHELAHALAYPQLNEIYGEGRRIGKLGVHRTEHEAVRAVHWEWLAAHKQRELLSKVGVNIGDAAFNRELNTVMHDAVHRAVTGKFTEPSDEGFIPHSHKVPLETALGMVRDAAHNLGLRGSHDLLMKAERSADVSEQQKYSMADLAQHLAKSLKDRIADCEGQMLELRKKETSVAKSGVEKCGDMKAGKDVAKKAELCADCGCKNCKCEGVLPGDKKSKDLTPNDGKDGGSGGEVSKGKLGKADVPMAAAPTKAPTAGAPKSQGGSPKIGEVKKSVAGLRKNAEERLAKGIAGPRLGGKDPMSQQMTQHAQGSAPPPKMAEPAPQLTPKLNSEEQSKRHQMFADFTPAGAHAPAGQSQAAAGAMKPAPTPPVGVGHLKPPQGTSAKPGGLLQRFSDALHGKKQQPSPAPAPTQKPQ